MRMAESVVEMVRGHAATVGSREAFAYIPDAVSGAVRDRLTYAELDRAARAVAGALREDGLVGAHVLLALPTGIDFVTAFMGCLYAGAVAVPAPSFGASDQVARLAGIVDDAEIRAAFTSAEHLPGLADWLAQRGLRHVRCLDPARLRERDPVEAPPARPDDLALIQYTSGSTSEPRGVMLSHGNLAANIRMITKCLGTEPVRGLGWLPLIHDMGLIGHLLWVASVGGTSMLMPPAEFLKRPYRWLQLIGEYGVEGAAAPNFAYDLCVRTVSEAQIDTLDLSTWEIALNGAERIRSETLDRFAERFGRAGFRARVFKPCYGLAEATLFVTGTDRWHEPARLTVDPAALETGTLAPADGPAARPLQSSGRSHGCEVRIVDPETATPLPDGRVGEIWVRGPSVARGYWRRPELTAAVFGATTSDGEDGWLRTGDLGALHDGELYVVGRIKDVIVVRGRNVYPEDVERSVAGLHERFASGAVFSFSVAGDEVVCLQEVRRAATEEELRELAGLVRRVMVRDFGLVDASVALVRPGTIRRTTSGKVRRSLMRELFTAGELTTLYADLSPGVADRVGRVHAVSGVGSVGAD